ncbi:MAG: YbjN domain-containing protein [Planctomycetaceae bacterium]|nr:YbjN domain-containing protein [Planctomycetaceae bacterium]MCB9951800.1 YbjN domain-containing protein [Planctomycetaceae bacterium]
MNIYPSKFLYAAAFAVLGLVYCQTSSQAADENLLTSFDELAKLLEQDSVPHEANAELGLLRIPVEKGGIKGKLTIRWARKEGVIHFIQPMSLRVPEASIAQVESCIVRLNHAIAVPGLGMNQGNPYFRLTVPLQPQGGISADQVRSYFQRTLADAATWQPTIQAIVNGDVGPENIVAWVSEQRNAQAIFPAGVYVTEALGSTWALDFSKDGTLKLTRSGELAVVAQFEIKGNLIRFVDQDGPLAVEGAGIYQWQFDDNQLQFKKAEDTAEGREKVLTSGPWTLKRE